MAKFICLFQDELQFLDQRNATNGIGSSNLSWPQNEQDDDTGDKNLSDSLIGDNTDEVPSRGIWRHYKFMMETA